MPKNLLAPGPLHATPLATHIPVLMRQTGHVVTDHEGMALVALLLVLALVAGIAMLAKSLGSSS